MHFTFIKYFSLFPSSFISTYIFLSLDSHYLFFTNKKFFNFFLFKKKLNLLLLNPFFNRWMYFSSFVFFVHCFFLYTFYKNKNSIWGYQNTPLNNSFHTTSVYLNHHNCPFFTSISSLILPVTLFIEKSSKYVNIEGTVYQTRRILRKFNSTKYDWLIWQDFFVLTQYSNTFFLNVLFSLYNFFYSVDSSFKYFFYYYSVSVNYVSVYPFITSCLMFEFPYFNFLNFTQSFFFNFFFFLWFFFFSFFCSGEYSKFSFFMGNIVHVNSALLSSSYKKYIFSQYSSLLYNHTYLSFY